MKELFQTGEWKQEKHIPVIELLEEPKRDEPLKVKLTVGKEIPHPNTTQHHISWIEVYFLPQGEKFPYQIGRFEFASHGSSIGGADTSSVYTHPEVVCSFKTGKSGKILASSYCNIHGLWEGSLELNF